MQKPKRVLIVGGGTAGWMAASILMFAWRNEDTKFTLIESDRISTIGVGEGSTPALRKFFSYLGIREKEWMPRCNATYKAGIFFDQWCDAPSKQSYFHPFFTAWDKTGAHAFVNQANKNRAGKAANAHPDSYFLNFNIASSNKSPLPVDLKLGNQVTYGYHFDAGLLAEFLRERAIKQNLNHIIDDIENVKLNNSGDIEAVSTRQAREIKADLFIDCSGFSGLLINKALAEPFISFEQSLFNNAAVTIATPPPEGIPAATRSHALSCGWAWKIPLTNRYGNGYVYSDNFISKNDAEQELRNFLGQSAGNAPAKHLKMRVGRVDQHWKNNCLAVGLSQSFIEPLEATALSVVQSTLENFVDSFDRGVNAENKAKFNQYISSLIDGIRDYIVAHYLLNKKNQSDYWRACRLDSKPDDKLLALIESWDNNSDFIDLIYKQKRQIAYQVESWYCLLAGMDRFKNKNLSVEVPFAFAPEINRLLESQFIDHRKCLEHLNTGTDA